MPRLKRHFLAAILSALAATGSAAAQEPETIPFAGGILTITENEDYEKVLAFDGVELARDYFLFADGISHVAGTDVAFFSVGPGGNQCPPSVVMIWRPEGGAVRSATHGDDCGSPSAAITDGAVFFVPYLLPGEMADVRAWTPDEGFWLHGRIGFAPEPGTTWGDIDAASVSHPMDLFRNADLHDAAQAMLGNELTDVASGLGTANTPEVSPEGLIFARGCVPHACGLADTLIVVDLAASSVYFAQQGDRTRFWPAREAWPDAAASLLPGDF